MTATFGFQGAHAESGDEFDVLLDDVQSAGLNGVDRVIGASHRGGRQDQGISVTTPAGSSFWDSGRTSLRRCRKSDDTDEFLVRKKGGGRGKRGPASNPEARKRTMEEAGSFFSGVSKNWEREVILPVVPCAQRAQPSTLTPGASERGSIDPVFVELWRRYRRRRCCSSNVEV